MGGAPYFLHKCRFLTEGLTEFRPHGACTDGSFVRGNLRRRQRVCAEGILYRTTERIGSAVFLGTGDD